MRVLRVAYDASPTTSAPAASSARRPTGCSTTSTSSPPRSPTSAATCRAPTRARCRRWPRASTPARPASTRWPSSSCGTATAASTRQQPGAVPEQLPARRAAHDRRAVGLAEHAQAGPHREPAPSRRRTAGGARRAPRRRPLHRGQRRGHGRGRPPPAQTDPAFIVQLLHRMREYGVRLPAIRVGRRRRPRRAAHDRRRDGARRASAPGVAQVSVANAITSLRLCATLDWQDFFESVSLVEQVLQRDPAGAYARMDFLSRDQQRQAVEQLAEPTGEAQVRVALKAVETARQATAAGSRAPPRGRSRRARRLSPRRPGPRRSRGRSRPTSRALAERVRRLLLGSAAGALPGQHRRRHRGS